MSDFPRDEVECDRCQGNGEVETWGDFFNEGWARCWECCGSGFVEVCANCLGEELEGCSVCSPPAPLAALNSDGSESSGRGGGLGE